MKEVREWIIVFLIAIVASAIASYVMIKLFV